MSSSEIVNRRCCP